MPNKTFALTGATGFVGSQLVRELLDDGHRVIELGRHRSEIDSPMLDWAHTDLASDFDLSKVLTGVDCVFHLAARAHVMHETSANPDELYKKMNLDATRKLAEQARSAGVKHFVFLSSVKAVGEGTSGQAWTISTEPKPLDAYGRTKLDAERALAKICDSGAMTYTVVRSPLVYGPGVRANFLSLIKAVDKGLPLPFGLTHNRRSIVAKKNLTSALRICADNPNAKNKTFFVSDLEPLSTTQLIREIAVSLGKKAKLLPVPIPVLSLLGMITGKGAQISRLTGDLEVDISTLQKELGWKPPLSTREGLKQTADWYRSLQIQSRNH